MRPNICMSRLYNNQQAGRATTEWLQHWKCFVFTTSEDKNQSNSNNNSHFETSYELIIKTKPIFNSSLDKLGSVVIKLSLKIDCI